MKLNPRPKRRELRSELDGAFKRLGVYLQTPKVKRASWIPSGLARSSTSRVCHSPLSFYSPHVRVTSWASLDSFCLRLILRVHVRDDVGTFQFRAIRVYPTSFTCLSWHIPTARIFLAQVRRLHYKITLNLGK